MLIPTLNVAVLRCPSCGRLEYRSLCLFSFGGGRTWQAVCSCGTPLLTINRKKGRHFWLQYHCGMCGCLHVSHCDRQELWSREVLTLTCRETDLEAGFIGPREKVQRAVQRHDRTLAEVAQDLGFDDYLQKSDIMYQLLILVYQLAETGHVNCGCGNEDIEIEIFPDHLQLRCEACRTETNLPAATLADLERVARMQEIRLPGHLSEENPTPSKQPYRRRRQKSPV